MTISTDPIEHLRTTIRGEVLQAGEAAYDERRQTFNAMVDRRPRVIVRPADTADVVAAVRWAAANDLPISVRGGGHNVAGHAVGTDALMLDMGAMRSVSVDPDRKLAEASGGALLEDLDRATIAHELAAPSGTYLDTGVAGLTLTGGIGYLLGAAGFACDALVGAELVTAGGEVLQVDEQRDPDLLWALRGGGGNFGVVTKLRHALTPVRNPYGGRLRFEGDSVETALRLLFELQGEAASDDLTLQSYMSVDPDRGPVMSILGLWIGEPELGPRVFAPLRAIGGAFFDSIGPYPYLDMQVIFARMGAGYRNYWKGHFVRDVGPAVQDVILASAAAGVAHSGMLLEPIHGAAHRFGDDHAAFGSRRALANVSAIGIWEDPADDAAAIAWAREATTRLEPFSLRGGGYLNYAPEDEPAQRVEQAFGAESFARLRAVKRRLDPENRFRFNANIPPA
jgi:FAD/FMN-containing dehydrogenase